MSSMRNRGRALIKFLLLWIRHSKTDHRPTTAPTMELTPNNLQFTYKPPCGRRRGNGGGSAAKTAAGPGSSRSSSSKKKANSPQSCCVTTTVLLNEALGVFTKLFVLCRRCRRPCTTLYANQNDANNIAQHGTGGKESAGAAAVIPEVRGRRVTLWVECQQDVCRWRSGMGVAAAGGGSTAPPPWSAKFARYVQSRAWKVRYYKRRECMCLCVGSR